MNFFLEILKNYWRLILTVVFLIISIILLIKKKKPVNGILTDILIFSLAAVLLVEETGYKGITKLNYAISIVQAKLIEKYPDLDVMKYKEIITHYIEAILSTPQKHEKDER